jgi:hypothetical protein
MTTAKQAMQDLNQKMIFDYDSARVQEAKRFRGVYDNDYDSIKKSILYYYTNKPFKATTLTDKLHIQHSDITENIIDRLVAGIYDKEPIRELVLSESEQGKEVDPNLYDLLTRTDFHNRMIECLRKAMFFNTSMLFAVIRDGEVKLDILTPDMVEIAAADDDYLKMEGIKISYSQEDLTTYSVMWSKDYHWSEWGDGSKRKIDGNDDGINPFKIIPIAVLRMREGADFFGEPSWGIFLTQLAKDLKLSMIDLVEFFQGHGILFGVNTGIASGESVFPGKIINVDNVRDGDVTPSLEYITSSADIESLRQTVDYRTEDIMRSKNIMGSTADLDSNPASGASKEADVLPVYEKREITRSKIWRFEMECLKIFRIVYNYAVKSGQVKGNKLNELGEFNVVLQNSNAMETQDQKSKRREYELKYHIKDEVMIVAEELECSIEDAEKHIQEILQRRKKLGLDQMEQQQQNQRLTFAQKAAALK